ncbi:hypothetical protein ACFV4K_16170 [Nocardia sp. NPDC059764]|uniref:hypothetical protein n=1 Tax=Nocardia sp. NPDC059764 TaxID=3346939 RepID=UPI00364B6F1D
MPVPSNTESIGSVRGSRRPGGHHRRGSTATALSVHGLTAAMVATSGVLVLRRENR